MINKKFRMLGIVAISVLAIGLVGCTSDSASDEENVKASLGEQLDYTITGIDAGAGVVRSAEESIVDYALSDYKVQTSSSAAMTQALADAIANEEPIIVTGWNPHWIFAKYELKYLDDPKGSFGSAESINTIARLGLKEDKPEAYSVLDNFKWEGSDMESVMIKVNEGKSPEEVARQWVDDNQDKVA
ncbi:MAG: glycine betaine ABC transporter substrate-binding protein, partial [Acidaminobacteraceae bacterium]